MAGLGFGFHWLNFGLGFRLRFRLRLQVLFNLDMKHLLKIFRFLRLPLDFLAMPVHDPLEAVLLQIVHPDEVLFFASKGFHNLVQIIGNQVLDQILFVNLRKITKI